MPAGAYPLIEWSMRASYRPAFWSVPTLRRQTGMESERGGARTRARNPLFRVQCLRAHPYGRKEALIAKVRQRTDVARADQAGQARPGPFECAACGNRVKSSNTDRFFFWYMSFDNGLPTPPSFNHDARLCFHAFLSANRPTALQTLLHSDVAYASCVRQIASRQADV